MKIVLSRALALGIAGACAKVPTPEAPLPIVDATPQHELRWSAMGTVWSVQTNAEVAPRLREALERECLRYEATFSDWSQDSELRRLEKGGLSGWHAASPLFLEGLRLAQQAWNETRGAFDISVGAVIWKARSQPVGLKSLRVEAKRFRFSEDPKRLSFGGLAKGMAVGALAHMLARSPGIDAFRIDAGGGNAVRASRARDEFIWISRSASQPGPRAHIIDPTQAGRSLEASAALRCSSRWSESAQAPAFSGLADAWSTALVVDPSLPPPAHCSSIRP
jgi:thiamine biosynthesis lipoprotein ApbE